jgi:hypothetical protein
MFCHFTVDSFALFSLLKAICFISVNAEASSVVKANIAENGVCPFKNHFLFKSNKFVSISRFISIISVCSNHHILAQFIVAQRGLTINGLIFIHADLINSRLTTESFPHHIGTI